MSEERKRILEMLKKGKISTDEAEELLDALEDGGEPVADKKNPRYLRVDCCDGDEKANIRIPIGLIRAGGRVASFVPGEVTEKLKKKGIKIDLKSGNVEEFIQELCRCDIDVKGDKGETVRIYCE